MRDIGHSLGHFVKIGLIATVFIVLFKWLANKVPVPGLTAAANAV